MTDGSVVNPRVRSVLPLSLFFAYVLAFLFEGPAFYSLADYYGTDPIGFVMVSVTGECLGLLGGAFFIKNARMAKRATHVGMAVCFVFSWVFFFPPSLLWMPVMAVCVVASGVVCAAWGYFLKAFTPSGQRIKSCADVLILSNLLMIPVNLVAIHFSPFAGLGLALALIAAAMLCAAALPSEAAEQKTAAEDGTDEPAVSLAAPLAALVAFVFVITINSGLMYQIIVPAYEHLTGLTSWYWVVPYIAALAVMRNLSIARPRGRPYSLYLGMGMIMAAFIFFAGLGRGAVSYIVVDTLMLGACGIFDLFWWSILGEMLDLSKRPALVFGVGLSANVSGILAGNLAALLMGALNRPPSSVTIMALTVVCVTLMLLPPLNNRLSALLKNHAYLKELSVMSQKERQEHMLCAPHAEPLTQREQDVLMQALSGKTNKAIAEDLSIGENTVKTHLRNIYGKYQVSSRSELISLLLNKPE